MSSNISGFMNQYDLSINKFSILYKFHLIKKDNVFRCGHIQFDYSNIDDQLLSISLYDKCGECTMMKTLYRITTFTKHIL